MDTARVLGDQVMKPKLSNNRKNSILEFRGLNDQRKRSIIRGCLNRWKPSIVCLQETKMETITEKIIKSIWQMDEVDWHFLPTKGSAGGILIMWRKDHALCHNFLLGETTLSCLFSNLNYGILWYFSGVYCRGNNDERTKFGEELSVIRNL